MRGYNNPSSRSCLSGWYIDKMKKISVYEYADLSKEVKERVLSKAINEEVEFQIELLTRQLNQDQISEEDYYKVLGCSKSYAESTGWFVPSCYYEKHEKQVRKEAMPLVKRSLYTKEGRFIQGI